MIIDIDSHLESIPYRYKRERAKVLERTADATTKFIRTSVPDEANEFHPNYLEYLSSAYAQHNRIVITPDILWFAVINEIAKGVVEAPVPHGPLFTRSLEKLEIGVAVGAPDDPLPLDAILAQMTDLVPLDINLFIPTFTTTTPLARLTHMASFAEAATPYYSYMTFLCGYPAIKVEGTVEDYDLIIAQAINISNEFSTVNSPMMPWMDNVLLPTLYSVAKAVRDNNADFFRTILWSKSCGSGGEIALDGWWTRLFRQQPDGVRKPVNFPTQIARVPWKNIESGREFTLNCGIFHSILDADGFAQPQFGWVQNEISNT